MSPSALERHDLEQDIDELRSSIESLQSSRSRLRDLLPSDGAKPSGTVWTDLTEIVTDFFEAAGEAITEGADDDDDDDDALGKAARRVKKVASTDWSKALADAFGRLRDRVTRDAHSSASAPPPVGELGVVLGELDAELARLNADLQQKLDRVAELDGAIDAADPITPVQPPRPDVLDDDLPIVTPHTDDVDVVPLPVDVLPEVDPAPKVVPDDDTDVVVPTPTPDVIPVDVIPVPDPDDVTPSYEPDKQAEIGELDGSIYDVNDILAGGRSVADLRRYDVPAGVVRDAGVATSAMVDGGYSLAELREAGCQSADLHGLASAGDLRSAGYTAADLHGVFSISECVEAFSPHELRDAGFSVSDFHGLVAAGDLRDVFSVAELRTVFSVGELRAAGFDAADLSSGGIGWEELAASGFSLSDLENAGASEAALRNIFTSDFSTNDDDSSQ